MHLISKPRKHTKHLFLTLHHHQHNKLHTSKQLRTGFYQSCKVLGLRCTLRCYFYTISSICKITITHISNGAFLPHTSALLGSTLLSLGRFSSGSSYFFNMGGVVITRLCKTAVRNSVIVFF